MANWQYRLYSTAGLGGVVHARTRARNHVHRQSRMRVSNSPAAVLYSD